MPANVGKDSAVERSLARYLRHHQARGSSVKTLAFHREGTGGFIKWLGEQGVDTSLQNLTAVWAREWILALQGRELAPSTVNRRVRSLKAFSRWLVEEEVFDKDPLARLALPKVGEVRPKVLELAGLQSLLEAVRATKGPMQVRDTALLLLLFSTGLRASELLALRREDVDWRQGLILVRLGKGGRVRTVPLSGPTERALDKYWRQAREGREGDRLFLTDEGTPLTYPGLRQILRRWGEKAGVPCSPHMFRHGGACQYLRNGGRVETLRTLLGHSTLTMTLHYARLTGVDVTREHVTADPVRGLKI